MSKDKQVLGKGLDVLFGTAEPESAEPKPEEISLQHGKKEESILFLEVDKIKNNPYQPREEFDEETLQELADSIKQKGVIQAITVRKTEGGYELLSGERRLRASKIAGLEKIPAYILEVNTPEDLLEISLIENIQRKDLNALEVAQGYQRLINECNLTQEEVAEKVGKSRSAVTNFLRLLRLPEGIKQSIRKGEISEGHARAILAVDNAEEQVVLWKRITGENLTVRKTEEIIKTIKKEPKHKKIFQVTNQDKAAIDFLETKFREHFGTKVKIHPKTKTSGDIIIEYYTSEDLERIIELCKK
jgi:ParB family chromosome partitioning protein